MGNGSRLGLGLLVACSLVVGLSVRAAAQGAGSTEGEPETGTNAVCTAVRVLPPFVEEVDGELEGFAIDLWDEIARREGFEPSYLKVASVGQQVDAVRSGECEAATTAISITREREEVVDFSHPTDEGGLRIAVPATQKTGLGVIGDVLSSRAVVGVFAMLVTMMLIVGVLIWVVERRKNPDFSERPTEGIAEGIWWSSVTAMTVGYGDKVPKHGVGRLLTVVWMLTAVTLVAVFTATVTSELTVDRLSSDIASVDDLPGRRVAVVAGTTSEEFAREQRLAALSVESVDELVDALVDGQADAAIYDAPVLEYLESGPAAGRIAVVGLPLNVEYYGIAFPLGSDLREPVNQTLLDIVEDGTYEELSTRWFG